MLYLSTFRKFVEKVQDSLKSDNNNGYFTRRSMYIFDHISLNSTYNEKRFRQICKENQSTHLMFNDFSRKSFRLSDNVEIPKESRK